jgi:hypothetical protein
MKLRRWAVVEAAGHSKDGVWSQQLLPGGYWWRRNAANVARALNELEPLFDEEQIRYFAITKISQPEKRN